MDLRSDGWKARVKISGVGQPVEFSGSVARIIQQLVPFLTTATCRANSQGARTIQLEMTTGKLGEVQSAEASVLDSLIANGLEDGTIQTVSNDAILSMMQPWQSDPRWQRFNELQASQQIFAQSVDEYEGLWQYVQATWPEYAKNVKRRSL